MSASYELDIRGQHVLDNLQQQAQNCCQQPQYGYLPGLGYQCYNLPCPPNPLDFELTINQVSDGEPLLHYGAKLRLVIADPIKGIDLREAIAKLKTALKEAYS